MMFGGEARPHSGASSLSNEHAVGNFPHARQMSLREAPEECRVTFVCGCLDAVSIVISTRTLDGVDTMGVESVRFLQANAQEAMR